jgi:hypothetical protein
VDEPTSEGATVDPVFLIVLAAIAAAAAYWWFRRRNSTPPPEDEWRLPPETAQARPASPPEPQVLDRDTVLGGKRAFDPSGWDNTPDGSGGPQAEPEPGELPRYFDRDYLDRKQRGESPAP